MELELRSIVRAALARVRVSAGLFALERAARREALAALRAVHLHEAQTGGVYVDEAGRLTRLTPARLALWA